jgi:hypothetical protein
MFSLDEADVSSIVTKMISAREFAATFQADTQSFLVDPRGQTVARLEHLEGVYMDKVNYMTDSNEKQKMKKTGFRKSTTTN